MTINVTTYATFAGIAAVILFFAGYYLGVKKTSKPLLTAVSLAVSAIVPVVAIIYLLVLLNKPNLPQTTR